jgi:hypothetical protein
VDDARTVHGDVIMLSRLYFATKSSHVGIDVDGLEYL